MNVLRRIIVSLFGCGLVGIPFRAFAADVSWATDLPPWTRTELLGMGLWQLGAVLTLIFAALLLRRVVFWFLSSQLKIVAGRVAPALKDSFQRSALPISGLTMALVFGIGFPFTGFPIGVDLVVERIVSLVAVVSGVWFIYRQIDVLAGFMEVQAAKTETKLDDQLVPLARRTLKSFVVVIGGIFILQNFNVDVASLIAGLGLGGLAFALAAKDTVANLFGSLVIFVDRPFQIGDWVVIDSTEGMVEDVGFRTTRIRTFYNSLVTVPNSKLTASSIDNMGARTYRRIKVSMSLTYSTTADQMQAFVEGLRGIVEAHPQTRKDYYQIHFHTFGDFSLDVLFYVFVRVPDWSAELKARHELFLSAMKLAEAIGVEFAFPTRTVHLDRSSDSQAQSTGGRLRPDRDELAEIVAAYGPGGERANPRFDFVPH